MDHAGEFGVDDLVYLGRIQAARFRASEAENQVALIVCEYEVPVVLWGRKLRPKGDSQTN